VCCVWRAQSAAGRLACFVRPHWVEFQQFFALRCASASALIRFSSPPVPPFHPQARFTTSLRSPQASAGMCTVLSFFPTLLPHRRDAIRASARSARNRVSRLHWPVHHPSQCLHCPVRSAIVSPMFFGVHLPQVHTVRPNPALKGTPRVRGFAIAPGSPLACIR
jgi:hypothetical protein